MRNQAHVVNACVSTCLLTLTMSSYSANRHMRQIIYDPALAIYCCFFLSDRFICSFFFDHVAWIKRIDWPLTKGFSAYKVCGEGDVTSRFVKSSWRTREDCYRKVCTPASM